jgi:diguanylate cyclase (GGDEF)-like protein
MSGHSETSGRVVRPGTEETVRDPITSLAAETFFRSRLPREFAQAREKETNGSLLAVTLDGLIEINRAHGRNGGDEALRAVAQVLSNYRAGAGREAHLVFKLGGPTFGYFIPACTAGQARQAAEDLHRLALESELYLERLSISIGIVNFYEFFMEEGTPDELALRVEQTAFHRLSLAGQQGGNTICDSSGTTVSEVTERPRILIVDPEPGSMDLLKHVLEADDMTVDVRADGEGAMEYIEEQAPTVVICEAMTPRLDGFAIRERLRTKSSWNAIPFILVSHRKNEDFIRKAVALDIRHFFRKPVSLVEVAGLVENLTRRAAR